MVAERAASLLCFLIKGEEMEKEKERGRDNQREFDTTPCKTTQQRQDRNVRRKEIQKRSHTVL